MAKRWLALILGILMAFPLFAWAEGELFRVYISFYLPNTMDGDDTAELNCTLTGPELKALIEDLDQAFQAIR